jgi:hypothetical protein
MNYGAKLFHTLHPRINFFGISNEQQEKYEKAAQEFMQMLNDQQNEFTFRQWNGHASDHGEQ